MEELVVGTPDDDGLLVFPNPTNETVTAYLPDGYGGQYFVFSSAGQLLSYGKAAEGQRVLYLNSAGFDAGMYYLRYASSNGQANTAKYFILK
ncbi:MAG: T9SS type A sorting domain-containing protein [Saprospirales bacterium]|nr:T9SS type A sorting domain-containing protein [Saprospirales bacterium]